MSRPSSNLPCPWGARWALLAGVLAGCSAESTQPFVVAPVDPCALGCAEDPEPPPDEAPVAPLPPVGLDALVTGDLQISELHYDPASCDPDNGQYVELFNTLDRGIDLTGLQLVIGEQVLYVRDLPVLAVGDTILLAPPTQEGCFGDALAVDVTYDEPLRFDEGDSLLIASPDGNVLDDVRLADLPAVPGAAAVRSDDTLTADRRVLPRWCHAQTAIVPGNHALPDLGSPGALNGTCAGEWQGPTIGAHLLSAGDLVITEVMSDPAACPDYRAEYIEVLNTTSAAIDLRGMSLRIDGRNELITESRVIAPGAWAVAEFSTTLGVVASCYVGVLDSFTFSAGRLDDEGSLIELINQNGVIDAVDLRGVEAAPGASVQLDAGSLDAVSNDEQARWCVAPAEFVGSRGDRGSPGAGNVGCP